MLQVKLPLNAIDLSHAPFSIHTAQGMVQVHSWMLSELRLLLLAEQTQSLLQSGGFGKLSSGK